MSKIPPTSSHFSGKCKIAVKSRPRPKSLWTVVSNRGSRGALAGSWDQEDRVSIQPLSTTPASLIEDTGERLCQGRNNPAGVRRGLASHEKEEKESGQGSEAGIPEPFTPPASVPAEPAPARPPQCILSPARVRRPSTSDFRASSRAGFAPLTTGHTPTGKIRSH